MKLSNLTHRLSTVATACEMTRESVTLAGEDKTGHAADLRAVLADLAARDALIGELRKGIYHVRHNCGWQTFAGEGGGGDDEIGPILDALLARTPADAGAELARLRKEVRETHSLANSFLDERDALRAQLASAEAMRDHHAACCRDYLARNQQLEQRAEAAEARVTELEAQREQWRMSSVCRDLEARLRAVTEALDLAETAVQEAIGTFEGIRGESQYCDECHAFERATEWIDNWHGGARVFGTAHAARSADLPPHPDTERLDWLEAHISNVDPVSLWRGTWGMAAGARAGIPVYEVIQTDCDLVFDASPKRGPDAHLPTIGEGSTLRAAIDAARNGGAK